MYALPVSRQGVVLAYYYASRSRDGCPSSHHMRTGIKRVLAWKIGEASDSFLFALFNSWMDYSFRVQSKRVDRHILAERVEVLLFASVRRSLDPRCDDWPRWGCADSAGTKVTTYMVGLGVLQEHFLEQS